MAPISNAARIPMDQSFAGDAEQRAIPVVMLSRRPVWRVGRFPGEV
jgi:hypothetical protein